MVNKALSSAAREAQMERLRETEVEYLRLGKIRGALLPELDAATDELRACMPKDRPSARRWVHALTEGLPLGADGTAFRKAGERFYAARKAVEDADDAQNAVVGLVRLKLS